MQAGILDLEKPKKDRKTILREEKAKKEKRKRKKSEDIEKTKEGELLREMTVKTGLERIDIQEGIIVKTLLDSEIIGLVMN